MHFWWVYLHLYLLSVCARMTQAVKTQAVPQLNISEEDNKLLDYFGCVIPYRGRVGIGTHNLATILIPLLTWTGLLSRQIKTRDFFISCKRTLFYYFIKKGEVNEHVLNLFMCNVFVQTKLTERKCARWFSVRFDPQRIKWMKALIKSSLILGHTTYWSSF